MGLVTYIGPGQTVWVTTAEGPVVAVRNGVATTLSDATCAGLLFTHSAWWQADDSHTQGLIPQNVQPLITVTSATVLQGANVWVLANATVATFAVTLPDARTMAQKTFYIKNIGSANGVTLMPLGGQTIDGNATLVLTVGQPVAVFSDGTTNWRLLSTSSAAVSATVVQVDSGVAPLLNRATGLVDGAALYYDSASSELQGRPRDRVYLYPSGDTTGATDDANMHAAIAALPNGGTVTPVKGATPFYTQTGWAPPVNTPAGTITGITTTGSNQVSGLAAGTTAVPASGSSVYVYGPTIPAGATLAMVTATTGVLSAAIVGAGAAITITVGGSDPTAGSPVCIEGVGQPTLQPVGTATGVWYHRTVDYGLAENGVELDDPPAGYVRGLVIDGSLSTTLAKSNLVNNPSFEYDVSNSTPADWPALINTLSSTVVTWQAQPVTDTTGWSAGGGSMSARLTVTVVSGGNYHATTSQGSSGIPVTGGNTYQLQSQVNVLTLAAGVTANTGVRWYDATGAFISAPTVAGCATSVLGVAQLAGTIVAPSNAAFATVTIGYTTSTGAGTNDAYFDQVMFSQSASVLPYGDGDSPAWSWSGTPGDSSSSGISGGLGIACGDGDNFDIDVTVKNFMAQGALGAYLANEVAYTTRSSFRIRGYRNNNAQVYIDVAGGAAAFDNSEIHVWLRANSDQNGVIVDAATLANCVLNIRGAMPASSATSGSVPTGNCAMLTVINGGQISRTEINAKVKADSGGTGSVLPYTLYSDSSGVVQQCNGAIITDLSGAFMQGAECSFSGPYNWNDNLTWPSTAFPGFGTPWVNQGPDAVVHVSGSGITAISVNQNDMAATSGAFFVGAGGSITLTASAGTAVPSGWSVAPARLLFAGSILPAPPGQVTGVSAVAGSGSATVSWTAPASGTTPTSYIVTPYIGSTAQATTTVSGTPLATSTTVSSLTPSTAYTFTVTAANAGGNGPESAASNSVTPTGTTVPGVPTNVSAKAGNGQVTVTWTAPSDGGSAITSYTITPRIAGVGQTPVTASGSPSTVTATNGTTYTFTVKATNAVGTGAASTASNAVTPVAAGGTTLMGATVNVPAGNYAATGGAQDWDCAKGFDKQVFTGSAYPTTTAMAQQIQKVYFADGELPSNVTSGSYQDGNFAAWQTLVITHNGQLLISLRPHSLANGGYQDTAFQTMVTALVNAYGTSWKAILYQEMNIAKHANVFPYPTPNGTCNPSAYITYAKHYTPLLRNKAPNISVVFNPAVASGNAGDPTAFYPSGVDSKGRPYVDEVYVDYYSSAFAAHQGLAPISGVANKNNLPFGIAEWGYSASGGSWDSTRWSAYINYLLHGTSSSYVSDVFGGFQTRRSKGYPNGWIVWWAGKSGFPGVNGAGAMPRDGNDWPGNNYDGGAINLPGPDHALNNNTPDPKLVGIIQIYTALCV